MGYFPNGTTGQLYEAEYCANCQHGPKTEDDDGCPVMALHLLYNYEQLPDPQKKDYEGAKKLRQHLAHCLSALIPRTKDKLGNEQCAMFLPITKKRPVNQDPLRHPAGLDD